MSGIGDMFGLNGSATPQYEKYNINTAMKTQNPGVKSDLGGTKMVQNPDGSFTTEFTSSANDKSRNNIMADILGQMGDTSGADMFYRDASKRLNKEFADERSAVDENLINRGIAVGNKQYTDTMGDLSDRHAQNMNELATSSIFKGQDLDSNRINNANALAGGRDIGQLASMAALGQNSAYNDYMTQSNAQSSANAAANASKRNNLFGLVGGLLG